MATAVYRFRLTKPVDDTKLAAEVGAAVSVANAGGVVVDVTTDVLFGDDLKDAMALRGYSFVSQDPTTTPAIGFAAGAGIAVTETPLDFGTPAGGLRQKTFTVVDANVSATSNVMMRVSGSPAAGRYADELEFDSFLCACLPAAGSFTAMIQSLLGPVIGQYKFQYEVR